jgi:hypothetical protein
MKPSPGMGDGDRIFLHEVTSNGEWLFRITHQVEETSAFGHTTSCRRAVSRKHAVTPLQHLRFTVAAARNTGFHLVCDS